MHLPLDHLILGVRDLDRGIDELENLTGVRASRGGRHQGLGTHNALISLGIRTYLEILAPDPEQNNPDGWGGLVRRLHDLETPLLVSWNMNRAGSICISPLCGILAATEPMPRSADSRI